MKTNKLIELLKEADPSGEMEVCINNEDIHFIQELPAYYDGNLNVLIRDKEEETYYNIIGCKIVDSGQKLSIETMGWRDVIENNPSDKILFENDRLKARYRPLVRQLRKEIIELDKKLRPSQCKECGFKSPKYDDKRVPSGEMNLVMRMVKCRCGHHGEWGSSYANAKESWDEVNKEMNNE